MTPKKKCKECKWVFSPPVRGFMSKGWGEFLCDHGKTTFFNIRMNRSKGEPCGPEGKLWEPETKAKP